MSGNIGETKMTRRGMKHRRLPIALAIIAGLLSAAPAVPAAAAPAAKIWLLNPAAIDRAGGDLAKAVSQLACDAGETARTACPAKARSTVAFGITADGAAATVIAIQTNLPPQAATISVTNEATLELYNPDFRSHRPSGDDTMLTLTASDWYSLGNDAYALAVLQAPDILHVGPDGNFPSYTQPITATLQIGSNEPAQTQAALDPPPILLVQGLWGDDTSLSNVESYLNGTAPWQGLPAGFVNTFSYDTDIAFDDPDTQSAVDGEIGLIVSNLTTAQVAVGRVDIVAHSMGGLVARHYSAAPDYKGPQNRTLGAYHQILTINTPEDGSELANFLITNQTAAFQPKARPIARLLVKQACNGTANVAACFGTLNQPVTLGAVASLEQGSPNISGLPKANIPNAIWRALNTNVTQTDVLIDNPSALVFFQNELIAATCPNAALAYCTSGPGKGPQEVFDILQTRDNDAVVTVKSQTSGCVTPCQAVNVPNPPNGLAHTQAAFQTYGQLANLDYANVLNFAGVNAQLGCLLANTGCANPRIAIDKAAETKTENDPKLPTREVKRLPAHLPAGLALGSPFDLPIRFPAAKVLNVWVRQVDTAGQGFGHVVNMKSVPVQAAPNGDALARITPLVMGKVDYLVTVWFKDNSWDAENFTVHVGPPASLAPDEFFADYHLKDPALNGTLPARIGVRQSLRPMLLFPSAPDHHLIVRDLFTYRLLQGEGAPVLELHPDGSYLPLRAGMATIEVGIAGFTAQAKIKVEPQ
jgi:pimeloyl-ACP methyl ester carboxylesterase